MSRQRDRSIGLWAPRVGIEAAKLRATGQSLMGWSVVIMILFVIIYGIGASQKNVDLEIGAYGVTLVSFITAAVGCYFLRAYRKAASRRLGIRIGWRVDNDVPLIPAKYEAWCRDHGLEPYSAGSST